MRVLRSTVFADAYSPPVMTVIRDSDTRDTLEDARAQLLAELPQLLMIFEIFEMEDAEAPEATLEALRRSQPRQETEKHMAMLYYWLANLFPSGRPGAFIGMDKPAPMSEDDMRYIFELLSKHPDYRDYTILGLSQDSKVVTLRDGRLD